MTANAAHVPGIGAQTVDGFLGSLAARVPVPGGGTTAALHVAQAAALVGMVARYSQGPRFADNRELIASIADCSDKARVAAVTLADDDARAFGAVAAAYSMVVNTAAEKKARSEAIAEATRAASAPPRDVIRLAAQVIQLAENLLPVANPSVVTDVAAASEAARAAATTARLNVEINLGAFSDLAERRRIRESIAVVEDLCGRATSLERTVRRLISGDAGRQS